MKYISTGGLGDAFIVSIKLKGSRIDPKLIEWTHVESNDLIRSGFESLIRPIVADFKKCEFVCDPQYIKNYQNGLWKGSVPVSSGVDTFCPLKGETEIELRKPLRYEQRIPTSWFKERYAVAIQVSAGAKNDRNWPFDPRVLQKILTKKGYKTILVGNNPKFYDESDDHNFVCKDSFEQTLERLVHCDNFVGLSGVLNYYCCYNAIPNLHLQESEEHDKRYYHPEWDSKSLKYGSIAEILRSLGE
jgi:hypothetical protein